MLHLCTEQHPKQLLVRPPRTELRSMGVTSPSNTFRHGRLHRSHHRRMYRIFLVL